MTLAAAGAINCPFCYTGRQSLSSPALLTGGLAFLRFLIRVLIDGLTLSWTKSGSKVEIMEFTCRTVVCSRSSPGAGARAVRLPEAAH